MINIYILTKEGKTWNQRGMDWIRNTLLDELHIVDKDAVQVLGGPLYNSPTWLLGALGQNEESFVIISWEHINVIAPPYMAGFVAMLEENRKNGVKKTSWETALDYMHTFEKQAQQNDGTAVQPGGEQPQPADGETP